MLSSLNMTQHINVTTDLSGNTLYVITTSENASFTLSKLEVSNLITDNVIIQLIIKMPKMQHQLQKIEYRNIYDIASGDFSKSLLS